MNCFHASALRKNRRGFGDALRLDRLGLRQADRFDLGGFRPPFRFDRRGTPGAFLAQLLLLRFRQRDERRSAAFGFEDRCLLRRLGAHDCRQAIGLGRLDDRRFELLLPAQDFLLLDRDQLLRPRALDPDLLGHDGLTGRRFRERSGLLGTRLLGLDLRLILRLPDGEVALRLGDLGVGLELRLLPFLHRLRGLDLRVPHAPRLRQSSRRA